MTTGFVIPTLEDTALATIIKHIPALIHAINDLPSYLQDQVFDQLNDELPLDIAVVISNELYWYKRLKSSIFFSRVGPAPSTSFSYKILFLEQYLSSSRKCTS
ncbi:hypothetical protein GEMRC1_000789 [Eukaryota sp. GEM-RC1]